MRPDQAEFLSRFLLPQLRYEQAITKKIMSAVPVDSETLAVVPVGWAGWRRSRPDVLLGTSWLW
jgi:hypothetical protein